MKFFTRASHQNSVCNSRERVAVVLLLALSFAANTRSFATAWRTNAAGAIATLSNWRDVATGASTPTSFTTAGDTWQIQNAMTESTTGWTVGTSSSPTSSVTMVTGGSISQSGGTTIVYGNVNFSAGSISPSGFNSAALTVYGNVSFNGTFKMTGSALGSNTVTLALPTASGTMTVDNSSTSTWSYTTVTVASGCTAQLDANFAYNTGSTNSAFTVTGTLIIPASYTYSGNTFTLNSGGTLQIANANGINGAITTTGAATYNAAGNYVFNGTSAQITGASLPATISGAGSLNINNTSGVTLSNTTTTVSASLIFTSGNLVIGAGHTLSISGTLSGGSSSNVITGSSTSALTIAGTTGTLGTLYFDQTTPGTSNTFSTFTMNRNGATATLGNSMNAGTLALTAGTIADGGNPISVSGNITGTGTCNGTGGVTMTGSGATISACTIGKLTLNNSGGFSLSGNTNISSSLNFINGILSTGTTYSISIPGTAGAVTGAGSSTYVNGSITKTITGLTSVNYEVGDAVDFAPMQLSLNAAGTAGTLAVRVTNGLQPQVSTSLINNAQMVNKYWTISNAGAAGPSAVTPAMTYNAADILGGGGNSNFAAQEYVSGAWSSILTATNTASTSYTTTVTTGVPLSSLAGAYIVGAQDMPCNAPATGPSGSISFPTTTATGGSVAFTNSTSSPTGYIVVESVGPLLGTPAATTNPAANTACCTNGTIVGVGSGTPIAITSSLSSNTSYTISVFDYNNTSCTGGPIYDTTSYLTSATLLTCPGISTAITNGTITSNSIAISWTGPSTGAASYTVLVYTNSGLTIPATGYSVSYSGTTATISGLSPITQYWYTVTGNNSSCSSAVSASQTGTTLNGPCSGTPAAGTATSTYAVITGTTSFTLGLSGASGALGLNYQWQSSACGDPSTFSNIPGAVSATYSTTESVATFYQCVVTCSYSSLSSTSAPVDVNWEPTYCQPTSTNGCSEQDGVNGFSLTGACGTSVSQSGMLCGAKYNDHTNLAPVEMYAGSSYAATINSEYTGDGAYIWIDYNDNGTFESTELVYSNATGVKAAPNNLSFSLPISATANPGAHRMRVIVDFSQALTTGCTGLTYGTTVDYAVQILPTPALSYNTPVCAAGGTLTLTALPNATCGATYTWSGPAGYSATTYNNNTVTPPVVAGTYSVSVTLDALTSCASPATTTVTLSPLPAVTASAAANICLGNTLTVNATPSGGSGAFSSYSWSGPGGFTATTTAATAINPGITAGGGGIYSVTVTDSHGCVSTPGTTGIVTIASLPSATATALPSAVCVGYKLTLNAMPAGGSGSYTSFAWNGPGGFVAFTQSATNPGMSVSGTGIYSVTVTDNNGCTSAPGLTTSVSLNSLPTVTAAAAPGILCPGATLTLNATPAGGGSIYPLYSWTGPGGYSASSQNATNPGITFAGAGVYTVTVTDNNGCTSLPATTLAISLNPTPAITAMAVPAAICAGGTITLNATPSGGSGTFTAFSWQGPGGFVSTSQNAFNSGVTTAGVIVYSVTVTDNNGCTSLPGTATVTVNALPTVTALATPNPVCPGGLLTLQATGIGGGGSYTSFSWTGPNGYLASTATAYNPGMSAAGVGVYSVSVTDNNGCSSAIPGTTLPVSLATTPTVTATVTPTAVCLGGNLTLNATAAGGSGTYSSFLWNGPGGFSAGGQTAMNNGIASTGAGIYSVTVTDSHGCTSAAGTTLAVTINPSPSVSGFSVSSATSPCAGGYSTVSISSASLGSGLFTVTYNLTGANNVTGHTAILVMSGSAGTFAIPTADLTMSGLTAVAVTSLANSSGCANPITTSNTANFTVNPQPASISGASNVCVASTTALIDTTLTGTWSSSNSLVATIGSSTGVLGGVSVGTVTISYTLSTGCQATTTEIVNPTAIAHAVTGGGTFCSSGTIAHVGLNNSDAGVSYQIYINGVASGGLVGGTGSPLDFGPEPVSGVYTVIANPGAACAVAMTGSATILDKPAPLALYAVTGGGSYCSGGGGVPVGLNYGQIGMSYQLYNGTAVGLPDTGTGYPINFGPETAGGTYTVIATNPANACTTVMTGNASVVVNPLPANISGVSAVCAGQTIMLGDASTGGAWSSSNTGLATVDGSGHLNAVSAGNPAITYTLPTGCFTTRQATVNSLPASIGGTANVCSGLTITLNDATTGGTWSSGATATALINSVSGVVTGVSGGAVSITYTGSNGCNTSSVITVNALPAINTVTGGGAYCAGGTGVHIGLNGSVTGVNYQLYSGASVIGSPVSGSGSPLDFGAITPAATYTVVATNATTGCVSAMSGSATVAVNPVPAEFTLSGGGSYCSGGTGADIRLSGTASGISYQLYNGSTPVGAAITGAGGMYDFGSQTAAGTYGAVATITATGCSSIMTGNPAISVLSLPAVYTVSGGGSYCAGGSGLHVLLSSSASGVSYQLYNGVTTVGSLVPGNGGSIDFGSQTTAGTYTVQAINAGSGCASSMSGSASITINPLPIITYSVTGGGGICSGATTTLTVGLSGSVSGTSYQLYVSGVPAGLPVTGTGTAFSFGGESTPGIYTVIATTPGGCTAGFGSSASIFISPLPGVYTVTGGGNYCSGSPSSIHIGLNGSATGVSYQLYNGSSPVGVAVAGNGYALDFGAEPLGTYTINAASSAGCTNAMFGSASVVANPLPATFSVSVTPTSGYCAGSPAPHVLLSGSVTGVNYQLLLSGGAVSSRTGTGSFIDFGPQSTSGIYTANGVTATTGCTSNMVGSATIAAYSLPTAYTVTGGGTYCTGGAGRTVSLTNSATGVSYQLYIGGIATGSAISGTTGSAISFPAQTTSGSYSIVATNTTTSCMNNMTGSVAITTIPTPTVYNVTGGGAYCTGTTTGVDVALSGSSAGVNYQLYRGGTTAVGPAMGGTGSAIDFGNQISTGNYTVVATNTSTSCTSNMFGTAAVTTVSPPNVYAVSASGNYCSGGSGWPVSLSNSDVGVSYQLLLGGSPVGSSLSGTGSTLSFGAQTSAGNYTVVATSGIGCTSTMSGTNTVGIYPLPVAFAVTSTANAYCYGDTGVHIKLSGSATGLSYQLYNEGIIDGPTVGGSGSALDFGRQTAGVYTVVASNGATGCSNTMSGTRLVTANPLPLQYPVTGGGSYCPGTAGVHVSLGNSATGVNYQLYLGATAVGSAITGTGLPLDFGLESSDGTYTVKATTITTGCSQPMTGSAMVSVNALPALHTVSGGGSYCAGTNGSDVYIDGSDIGVTYQLYNGPAPTGAPMAGTGSALHFGYQTAGTYTVEASNGASCTTNMTGSVMVSVTPLPTVYTVTGGGNYCMSGAGVHIGLSSSDAGIQYQLYKEGTIESGLISGGGGIIDFGLLTDTGSYTVVATNSTTGCTSDMSGIAAVEYAPFPTSYNVTGGGNYCAGGTGSAVGIDGSDVGTIYQLWEGATAIGAAYTGTGLPINFGTQTSAGIYTVVATNGAMCSNGMAGIAIVGINPLPDTFSVTGGGSYCNGSSGAAVGLISSDPGVNYELFQGGVTTGITTSGTGVAISFGLQTTPGTYSVIAVDNTTGCVGNMPGSAVVAVNPLPAAYAISDGGNYCPGGAGVDVNLSHSDPGISYQLFNGLIPGATLPGTGAALDFGLMASPGSYTILGTNTTTSCAANMTGTATVGTYTLPVAYSVSAGANQYCAGSSGVSIQLGGSQSGVNYQLYNGLVPEGVPVAGNGSPVTFGMYMSGSYTVIATDATTGCANNMTGTAAVAANPLPSPYPMLGGGNYCIGGSGVHVGLTSSAPGVSYQLYFGSLSAVGSAIDGNGFAIDFGSQTMTGSYTVVATDTLTGCSNTMTGSEVVGLNPLPAVSTMTGGGNYCASTDGLPVGLSTSATGVAYQLFNGAIAIGSPVPGSGTSISFGLQTSGSYTAVATNTTTGCTNNMAGSATITVSSQPTAFAVSGGGSYCAGSPAPDISLSNSSSGVNYQLYNGATPIGAYMAGTGSGLDFGLHTSSGAYTIVATDATSGCTNTMTGTASITENSLPAAYSVIGGGSYCATASGVHIGLSNSQSGINYQLFGPSAPYGLPVPGIGTSLDFGLLTAIGTYSVVATNAVTGCAQNMAGTATVTMNSMVTPSVEMAASGSDTVCNGSSARVIATAINGGADPTYSWTINGVATPDAGNVLTYIPVAGDVIGVTVTSSAACASPLNVTNSFSFIVLPRGVPSISVSSSAGDTVCQGSSITFAEVSSLGGHTPSFSWTVNGSAVGTSSSYTYTPSNGDQVACILTSDYQCKMATTAYSNVVRMRVDSPVTPAVNVVANPSADLPQGQLLTLTARVTNNPTEPAYQWYINGNPISGALGAVYSTNEYLNLDSFSCVVTSGGGCAGLKGSSDVVIHVAGEGVNQLTTTGSNVQIIPNPNKGVFTIKGNLGTLGDEQAFIEITNVLGQTIYKGETTTHDGVINVPVQLNSSIANGMYLLNLRSGSVHDVFHVVIEE